MSSGSELLGTIAVKLGLDADDFRAALASVKTETKQAADEIGYGAGKIGGGWSAVDKSMKGLNETAYTSRGLFSDLFTSTAAIGAGLGAAAAGAQIWADLLRAGFDGAMAQEEATKKLASALRAAGQEVDQNVGAFSALANELEATTGIGDDVVLGLAAMATNMGALPQDVDKTVRAAISLSNALGIDVNTALEGLMKTTDGTAGRLGALTHDFGGLTEEQLRNGEAVDWVNARYSDQLDLLTRGTGGALKQLSNAWGNLGEAMVDFGVKGLHLDKVFTGLAKAVGWLADNFREVLATAVGAAGILPGMGLLATGAAAAIRMSGGDESGGEVVPGARSEAGAAAGALDDLATNTVDLNALMKELSRRTDEAKQRQKEHTDRIRRQTELLDELNGQMRETVLVNLNTLATRPTETDREAKAADSENKAVRDWTAEVETSSDDVGEAFASASTQVKEATLGLAQRMGTAGQMFSEVAQGFAQGGPIGAIIAAIMAILSRLEFFGQITDMMDEDLGAIFKAFNELFAPMVEMTKPVSEMIQTFAGAFGDLFRAVGGLLEMVSSGPLKLVVGIIQKFAELFAKFAENIGSFAEAFGEGTDAIGEAVDGVLDALDWFFNALQDVLAFFGLAQSRTQDINETALATQAQLNAAFAELQLQVTASAKAQKELNSELTNAPAGFKIAQARFEAISTAAMPAPGANDWSGGFGREGLGGNTTWQVTIGTVQTDDPEGLVKAVEEKAAWTRFTETGTTSTGGGAAATWRGWR